MSYVGEIISTFFNWLMETTLDIGFGEFSLGAFIIAIWLFGSALGIICRYLFGGD